MSTARYIVIVLPVAYPGACRAGRLVHAAVASACFGVICSVLWCCAEGARQVVRMRWAIGTLLLVGFVAQSWADEWEEDDEVVVEDDVPQAVDPAAEARANHARMHGAPEWASDPEVLAVMEEPRVKELLETMTTREGAEAASKTIFEDPDLSQKFSFLQSRGVFGPPPGSGGGSGAPGGNAPPQEVAGAAFDFNKDGKLDPNEFVQMIFHQKPDAKDMTKEELVELFQSVDTDQSADVSEKEYDAWVDKQKEEQNKEYEKLANEAREEYMGDQMKQLEEHLKISNMDAAEKGLTEQVALDGGWFTFGSLDVDEDGFQEYADKVETENKRVEDMKEQIGDETFDLINMQLTGMGRQGMEKGTANTRDGGLAADVAKCKPFAMDKTAVTNTQFRHFIRDSKYKTEAEVFGWSFVLELLASEDTIELVDDKEKGLGRVKDTPWWMGVEGAYWRRPEGPDSSIKDRGDHPVVHVSWNDAAAYCKWAGRRMPTEKEWEFAARGGLDGSAGNVYPWGIDPYGAQCNSWEGEFPRANSEADGYTGTAPVDEYEPNGYGIYNMCGNVWEWVDGGTKEKRPLRGGSYVDTLEGEYNHAIKVSTRMENTADSGGANTGFRCAMSLQQPSKTERKKRTKSKKKKRDATARVEL